MITTAQACGPGRGVGGARRTRKLTPLVFKQHVPNVSEYTLGASGLQEGKINRTHPKFKDLVPNYNHHIIFKDEEGTGADRLMSQRCNDRLNTLGHSVMNQWAGVKLRVIEGWDEDDYHGVGSLHYEGRAVDITTSDRDPSKYGMLARLAVESGFDWVYYESRAHIHCSVKSDSSQVSHTSGCFTAASTVQTESGQHKPLASVQLGERVLAMDSAGNTRFSEVIMFLDRDVTQSREFVTIETSGGATLRVTPAHLLFVARTKAMQFDYEFAERVTEGDFLLVNVKGTLEPQRVRRISVELHRGVFAPLTAEGTVIVDSVAASCYALVESQSLAHWSFLPMRALNRLWHWFDGRPMMQQRQSGVHWYARTLYSMKDYLVPRKYLYHID